MEDLIHYEIQHYGISLYFDPLICLVLKFIMPAEKQLVICSNMTDKKKKTL